MLVWDWWLGGSVASWLGPKDMVYLYVYIYMYIYLIWSSSGSGMAGRAMHADP